MSRWLRACAVLGLVTLGSVVAALAALRTERGARALIPIVGRASGYQIQMQALHVSGWRWTADDLRVAPTGGAEFFRARRFTLELTAASLLRGTARSVALDAFELDFARMPTRTGGRRRQLFEELRASDGVVRHASATLEEIRVPEIVFARTQQTGGFDIHGRLESGADLEVAWSGKAAANGDDLIVRFEGTLRDVARILSTKPLAGADSAFTLSFEGDLSGSLRGDLHATAVAKASVAELRVPVRTAAVLDRSGATGVITYSADVIADGVTVPLKLSGLVTTEHLEMHASWRDLELSEAASLLNDPSLFDARAGLLSLDASVMGALHAPAFRFAVDVKNLSATASAVNVTGSAALSLAYAEGPLSPRESGLTLDDLELSTPAMKIAVKHLRAEPFVDAEAPMTSFRLERVVAEGLAFSDSRNELQASGIELSGNMDYSLDAEQRRSATLTLSAPRGEILYKRAYLDIASSPAELNLRISSKDTTWTGEGSAKLADLAELRADGDVDRSSDIERLHVTADVPRLKAPFEKLVRDTFADAYPVLARTSVAGAASADVELRTAASASGVKGRLRLRDVAFDVEGPSIHGKGLDVDLPIALSTGKTKAGTPVSGTIHIGETTFGNATIGNIDLPLTVDTNEITATAPLRILVAQGVVLVEGLRAHSLSSETPTLEAQVDIKDVDLSDVTGSARLPRVAGRVNGALGLVRVADGRVTTNAAIDVSAFGGNVHVSDVSLHELFSRVPALSFDAVLSGIDLRKVTETIGVGYVSGIAEGAINDLEIAAGAPVRFDARLESVPVAGVPQRISVTAVDQLIVLGGGTSGSLARGMMGLFHEYRYAKLGFRCSLSNDRFVLHGVAEHDGKDFLVVGTIFPPTVNVVSHNQVIGFKEMVERLQRVTSIQAPERQQQGTGDHQ